MYGVVYLILNKINGRKYVGQTVQPLKVRFREHAKKKGQYAYRQRDSQIR